MATGSVPVTPVVSGKPVALVSVTADGVPRLGVVSDGLVANTRAPEPVSSVTALRRLAEDGVARKVATPLPKPEMPVETGKPVAFVNVTADGVPRFGVVNDGDVDNTMSPVPVTALLSVTPPYVKAPVVDSVVNDPAAGVVPPMTVLSMVPASMSAVSATRLSILAVPPVIATLLAS